MIRRIAAAATESNDHVDKAAAQHVLHEKGIDSTCCPLDDEQGLSLVAVLYVVERMAGTYKLTVRKLMSKNPERFDHYDDVMLLDLSRQRIYTLPTSGDAAERSGLQLFCRTVLPVFVFVSLVVAMCLML